MWDEPEPESFIGTINSPFCVVALEISSSCCCHNGCDGSSADVSGITSDDDDGKDPSLSLHCKQIISLDLEGGESSSSSSLAAAAARDGLILLFADDIMSGGDSNAEVLPSVGRQEEDVMVSWSSSCRRPRPRPKIPQPQRYLPFRPGGTEMTTCRRDNQCPPSMNICPETY